ncbi:Protein of unknown function [Pyronema omphalodes CBS 100304]|uniref:Uncharacterized protein n=1 Tax=Pyronema omphalodes (strain CBS 100304) TaxID=1076935 RepID=U4LH54_PYROM|nr:Protein of unknown function [Pyronema omphalodes CBS 100304]
MERGSSTILRVGTLRRTKLDANKRLQKLIADPFHTQTRRCSCVRGLWMQHKKPAVTKRKPSCLGKRGVLEDKNLGTKVQKGDGAEK